MWLTVLDVINTCSACWGLFWVGQCYQEKQTEISVKSSFGAHFHVRSHFKYITYSYLNKNERPLILKLSTTNMPEAWSALIKLVWLWKTIKFKIYNTHLSFVSNQTNFKPDWQNKLKSQNIAYFLISIILICYIRNH